MDAGIVMTRVDRVIAAELEDAEKRRQRFELIRLVKEKIEGNPAISQISFGYSGAILVFSLGGIFVSLPDATNYEFDWDEAGSSTVMPFGLLDAVIKGAGIIRVDLLPDMENSEAVVASRIRQDAKAAFSRVQIRVRMFKRIFELLKEEGLSSVKFRFPARSKYKFINFSSNSSVVYKLENGEHIHPTIADAFDNLNYDGNELSDILDLIIKGKFDVESCLNTYDERWKSIVMEESKKTA